MELNYRRKMRMPLYGLPGFQAGTPGTGMLQMPYGYQLSYGNEFSNSTYTPDFSRLSTISPKTMYDVNEDIKNQAVKSAGIKAGLQSAGGAMLSSAINFTGDAINAFGPVKRNNEILADSGVTTSIGNGFQYIHQNDVNRNAELSEMGKQNTGNTLKTAASGAALGATVGSIVPGIGTLLGGAVGGVVGAVTGIFGGAHRKRVLKRRMFDAQQNANRYNNFNQSSAQSDYLQQNYLQQHDNTDDDIIDAKRGKDQNMILPGFKHGKSVYTSVGKVKAQPNSRVAAGESIIDGIDDVSKTTGHVVKEGKLNKDTNYSNLNEDSIVLGGDRDMRNGYTFRDQALPYTAALEKINNKYESRTNEKLNKLRGVIGKESDSVQQAEVNKLKQPIVSKLKDLSDQQSYQHQLEQKYSNQMNALPGYAGGTPGIPRMSWLSNAIPSTIGGLASLAQYFEAKRQDINTPDIYASNPYEGTALNTLSSLRYNPYPVMKSIQEQNARNAYSINRAGGLSGAQKYLATVASGLQTNGQIADAMYKSQDQNNQYKQMYANALMSAGNEAAQRRQQANQYNTEYAANAHASKLQGEQMGVRNYIDYLNQYMANEFKRKMGMGMLSLYQEDTDRDKSKTVSNPAKSKYVDTNSYDKLNFDTPYFGYGMKKYSFYNNNPVQTGSIWRPWSPSTTQNTEVTEKTYPPYVDWEKMSDPLWGKYNTQQNYNYLYR